MNRQAIALRCRAAFQWLRARVTRRRLVRWTMAITALGFATIWTEALVRARLVPPAQRLPTALYTRPTPWSGTEDRVPPLAIGTLDGAPLERRLPVELSDLPQQLIQAVIAVEDQRFYRHHGLDVRRIGGALLANIRAGAIAQGGSTVTQQLAKNLFLSADRTPLRKLREAALAVILELRYDKATILEAYLNEIYLGQDGRRAIHGVGGAARYYFGKDAKNLSLAEAALLAGMISAPNRYAPTRNPESARQRRALVLQLMAAQGRVTRSLADRAARTRLATQAHPVPAVDGRYFRDFVATSALRDLPARGKAVFTTLDARLQRIAEWAVDNGLDRLSPRGAQAALVALDPRTGEVLAMVGGRDYGSSQFNRATDARRQPGSAFKPIVAVAALERREGHEPAFTLASELDDEPLSIKTPQGLWQPANYDGRFHGRVTVRVAMEQSFNVPFARIGLAVGPRRIVETARRLGITSPLAPVPSLALGSSEVSLLELVRAYGVLAAGGNLAPTRTVVGQASQGADPDVTPEPDKVRVVDPAVAYLVTSTLEGVVTRGTGRALNGEGRFNDVAGKTGTSNDWRDAWFIAYSPTLVVGVWVGFDDGRSLRLTGAGAALPIVDRFLAEASSQSSWDSFEIPEGVSEGYAHLADAGWSSDCGTREYFLEGTEPSGGGCDDIEIPHWEVPRDWGQILSRRAARFLEDLIAQRLERLRGQH